MVGVHMGEQHGLDVGGIDARGAQVGEQLAGGGQQIVARSRLHQGETAGRVDQERVDRRAPGRPEVVGQDLAGFVRRDVAQDIDGAVEEAIADCGDDDVSNAVVIDAGYLLLRNLDHGRSWWLF